MPRERAREPYETAVLYGLSIRRTVENKTVLYGFPYGEWSRTVEKTVQRGTAPNRTVRYITAAPNRTVGFTISENRTEPHRRIPDF